MKNKLLVLLFLISMLFHSSIAKADDIEKATELYNEGINLYKQENIEGSIENFKKATQLNPSFYEAYYNLSQILMSENRDEEAFESLKKVVELKPDDFESLYNIGKLQYKRGYLSSSHSYLTKIKTTAPQYNSAKLLIAKIEKRQAELNLEAKIKEHKNAYDAQGKLKGIEIEQIDAPSGVAVDSKGNLYIASFSDDTIYKISIYGQKTTFAKSSLIKGPVGITVDKNDNVYVANYNGNNLVKITSTGLISIFGDIQKPYCIIYDNMHDRLYVTEQNTNKIVKFDL